MHFCSNRIPTTILSPIPLPPFQDPTSIMVCLACLLPLFLVPIVNALPLLIDFILAKVYGMMGWEYRKPVRVPPSCPYNPSQTTQKKDSEHDRSRLETWLEETRLLEVSCNKFRCTIGRALRGPLNRAAQTWLKVVRKQGHGFCRSICKS